MLAASSDYFKALFAHGGETNTSENIVLDSISPNGFKHLLRYMYTHQLEIDVENILDVLETEISFSSGKLWRNVPQSCYGI